MTTGRRPPGYMTEDLEMAKVSGPPKYTSRTDKAVEYIALADTKDVVFGYIYANDEDDAAGWQGRPAAGFAAQNLAAPWLGKLRDAKKRGLKPTAALAELMSASDGNSHVVPNSRQSAASISALKEIAGDVPAK
jgi:hypothetical protein